MGCSLRGGSAPGPLRIMVATYSANAWPGAGHTPIPDGGRMAHRARARKGGGNYLAHLPCFTGEETEAKRGESGLLNATQPKLGRDG